MKRTIMVFLLVFFYFSALFTDASAKKSRCKLHKIRTLKSREVKNLQKLFPGKSVSRHSFFVCFNNYEKVFFVSVDDNSGGPNTCSFYLVRKNRILYRFQKIVDVESYNAEIKAISFKDMNFDGYRDVTIILEYMTGVGSTGAIPFPAATIFFSNKKSGFGIKENVDIKIKDMDSISEIFRYMKGMYKK